MNKEKVIETLEKLPQEFSVEELVDRLLFIDKIDRGLKDVEEGKVISLEEAKDRVSKKWSK
jgi:predicted transcriptional regulator